MAKRPVGDASKRIIAKGGSVANLYVSEGWVAGLGLPAKKSGQTR